MLTPQTCEVYTLDFIWGEGESILHSPSRQTIYSALKPAFDGDNNPGTVANSDVIHIQ
jgi:hypothetical protein